MALVFGGSGWRKLDQRQQEKEEDEGKARRAVCFGKGQRRFCVVGCVFGGGRRWHHKGVDQAQDW